MNVEDRAVDSMRRNVVIRMVNTALVVSSSVANEEEEEEGEVGEEEGKLKSDEGQWQVVLYAL